MPLNIIELFGRSPDSDFIRPAIHSLECPFVGGKCRKIFRDGFTGGLCTAHTTNDSSPVICCPLRLYADKYATLRKVSESAFGSEVKLLLDLTAGIPSEGAVIPFGQGLGKELRIKFRKSSFSFDWILAKVDGAGELLEFIAVEVQTIDTTGNYRMQVWDQLVKHESPHISGFPERPVKSSSNFNYENVNKRILPQLITKGHLLRNEKLCKKGLYFVCPEPVLQKIRDRVGELHEYDPQHGAVTFHSWTVEQSCGSDPLPLSFVSSFTTTLDQLALAFSSPKDMPKANTYTKVIQQAVSERLEEE